MMSLFSSILGICLFLAQPLGEGSTMCRCGDRGVPALLEAADAVFIGKVLSVRDSVIAGHPFNPFATKPTPVAVAVLQVERGWKNPGSRQVSVIDLDAQTNCRADFTVGQDVLVWVKSRGGTFVRIGCNYRNVPVTRAQEILRELGPIRFTYSQ